jgi:hypothetical protein
VVVRIGVVASFFEDKSFHLINIRIYVNVVQTKNYGLF